MAAKQRAFIVKIMLDDSIPPETVIEDLRESATQDGYPVIDVAVWKSQDDIIGMVGQTLSPTEVNPDDAGLGVPGIGGLGL